MINQFINEVKYFYKQDEILNNGIYQIEKDYNTLKNILNQEKPPFIYGVNSLVGHLDHKYLSKEEIDRFQRDLISNHELNLGFGYYNSWQVYCIFFTKIKHILNGGTGISPELYKELIRVFKENNYNLKIPKNASYSCGDVVPGANFATEVISYFKKDYFLKDKDAISLINGNYISLGLALAIITKLLNTLDFLSENTIRMFKNFNLDANVLYVDKDRSNFSKNIFNIIQDNDLKKNITNQTSVSIRSSLKIIELFKESIKDLYEEILILLNEPSDNPLICEDGQIRSNSSFFSPSLALKLSNVLDVIQFCAWSVDRRIHYLLSGQVENVNINLSSELNILGAIQVPKLVTNILQNLRLNVGTRPFAVGLETSYGIEDIWTSVEKLVDQVDNSLDLFNRMLYIESSIINFKETNNYNLLKLNLYEDYYPYLKKIKNKYAYLI